MKKFFCLSLAICFLAFLPTQTYAFDVQSDVNFFVQSHRYTQEATSIVFGQYCVVGVRTKGILLKSENEKYILELQQGIKKIDGNLQKVYITSNLNEVLMIKDVKKKIDDGMGLFEIYDYIKQNYPNAIDKILSQNYNIDR